MGRNRAVQIVLGAGGKGKSSLARYFALEYMLEFPDAKIIIGDPARNWSRLGMGEWPAACYKSRKAREQWIAQITNHGRGPPGPRIGAAGGLLGLDDADMMAIPKNGAETEFNALWMIWRHLLLDILLISHRPQGIPLEAFAAASRIIAFYLDEPNALDYLAETSMGDNAYHLPKLGKGEALVLQKEPHKVTKINFFKVLPPPAEVERRILELRHARSRIVSP